MARTTRLMRKESGDPCRSYAQRTASGDETNEFDAKFRRKQ